MSASTTSKPANSRGFTLIELMIALVIAGVLVAVALPNFLDSMRKGRRTEAFSALAAMQQALERRRSNNPSFSATLAELGITSSTTRPGSYYTIAVDAGDASGYQISADGSGSSQANDGQCAKLAIKVTGATVEYAGCKSCSTHTFAATNACWSR